jgi:hypothetical protein
MADCGPVMAILGAYLRNNGLLVVGNLGAGGTGEMAGPEAESQVFPRSGPVPVWTTRRIAINRWEAVVLRIHLVGQEDFTKTESQLQ